MIQIGNGSGDEQSMYEDDAMEASDEDDEMEKLPATMMKASFALGGLQLNEVEDLLTLHDGFIGLPFIHRLTRTDVHLGMMVCISSSFFLFLYGYATSKNTSTKCEFEWKGGGNMNLN